jgi:tetratricopeptide (TPR) repeat protein
MNSEHPKHRFRWLWPLLFLLALTPALAAANPQAKTHFKRGLEHSLQQNWKAAEAEYREAVRLDPGNPTYRSYLADALAAQGKFQQAQESVQQQKKLEKAAPVQPKATTPKPAIATTTKPPPSPTKPPAPPAVKPTPPPPSDQGITIIESTLTDDPIATAIQLYEEGQWPQAEAEYRRVLRLKPGLYEGWNGLGDTYSKLGKWAEAEKAYREAVRLLPEESYYHAQLAYALLKQGRQDEARRVAQQAIRLGLENHEVFDELGLVIR